MSTGIRRGGRYDVVAAGFTPGPDAEGAAITTRVRGGRRDVVARALPPVARLGRRRAPADRDGASPMTPVPLALIGAGRMGRMHLQALTDSEALQIVTIVEPSEAARAAAAAIDSRPTVYAELDEALDAGGFEGVMIVAPTPLHATLVTACAERGLPILCEKPCGSSIAEIDAAAAAVARCRRDAPDRLLAAIRA